jgi:hypothetical protein
MLVVVAEPEPLVETLQIMQVVLVALELHHLLLVLP